MARTRMSELAAYHEAGHAVVSLHLGIPVQLVSVRTRDPVYGRLTPMVRPGFDASGLGLGPGLLARVSCDRDADAWEYRGFSRRHVDRVIAMCWAGVLAEWTFARAYTVLPWRSRFWGQPDSRIAHRAAWLGGASGPRCRSIVAARRYRTAELVRCLWPRINAVAQTLLRKRVLRPAELRAAVAAAPAPYSAAAVRRFSDDEFKDRIQRLHACPRSNT